MSGYFSAEQRALAQSKELKSRKSYSNVVAKIMPKAMVSAEILSSQLLTAAYNREDCAGSSEMILRSMQFAILFIGGLLSMNWSWEKGKNRFWLPDRFVHNTLNVLVVATWLLCMQPKPFSCWLQSGDAINEDDTRTLCGIQTILLFFVNIAAVMMERKLSDKEGKNTLIPLAQAQPAAIAAAEPASDEKKEPSKEFLDVAAKVLPKTLICLNSLSAQLLTTIFGDEKCSGDTEFGVRTGVIGAVFIISLAVMNWRYWEGSRCMHAILNLLIVSTWLLAMQPKPISCWIDDGEFINEESVRILTVAQAVAIAVVTALVTVWESRNPTQLSRKVIKKEDTERLVKLANLPAETRQKIDDYSEVKVVNNKLVAREPTKIEYIDHGDFVEYQATFREVRV